MSFWMLHVQCSMSLNRQIWRVERCCATMFQPEPCIYCLVNFWALRLFKLVIAESYHCVSCETSHLPLCSPPLYVLWQKQQKSTNTEWPLCKGSEGQGPIEGQLLLFTRSGYNVHRRTRTTKLCSVIQTIGSTALWHFPVQKVSTTDFSNTTQFVVSFDHRPTKKDVANQSFGGCFLVQKGSTVIFRKSVFRVRFRFGRNSDVLTLMNLSFTISTEWCLVLSASLCLCVNLNRRSGRSFSPRQVDDQVCFLICIICISSATSPVTWF